MKKIKAIIKRPDEEVGHMTWISNRLENLQGIVEGYIEAFTVDAKTVVICNEEGRIKNLDFNCTLYGESLYFGERIPLQDFYGNIIVIGVDGDDFRDVQIKLSDWKDMIRRKQA